MSRLLLLAWPGATAAAVSRLLDAQRLPHLLKLVETGAIADLRTDCPGPEAMTWTTVATGHRADVHHVLGDLRPRSNGAGVRWARSSDWSRPALWTLLDAAGCATAVVNWPATYPAVQLAHGACVSPVFLYAPIGDRDAWLRAPEAVWPADLRYTLTPFRIHPTDITRDEAVALVPTAPDIDQQSDPRLAKILVSLAANAGAHAVATHLAEMQPRRGLLAVHFDLLLAANEAADASPAGQAYRDTPDAVLVFYDQMLGRYLQLLGGDVSILIVSHGWRSAPGFLVARGDDVRADVRTTPCTTLDVLPIALRLLEREARSELPGVIPQGMFQMPQRSLQPLPKCKAAEHSAEEGGVKHLLEAGYTLCESPTLANWATRQRAADLAQLARVRLSAGDPQGAMSLAEQAEQLQPAAQFAELTARTAMLAGDFPRARAAATRLLSFDSQSAAGELIQAFLSRNETITAPSAPTGTKPEHKYYLGILAIVRGDAKAATELLAEAAEALPTDASVQHALGLALRQAGNTAAAITALGRATSLAPKPAAALVHLAQALLTVGEHERAEAALRQALGSDPTFGPASALLTTVVRRRALDALMSQNAKHSSTYPLR
jgi:tetratricopeptide (TPR) repeat protein